MTSPHGGVFLFAHAVVYLHVAKELDPYETQISIHDPKSWRSLYGR